MSTIENMKKSWKTCQDIVHHEQAGRHKQIAWEQVTMARVFPHPEAIAVTGASACAPYRCGSGKHTCPLVRFMLQNASKWFEMYALIHPHHLSNYCWTYISDYSAAILFIVCNQEGNDTWERRERPGSKPPKCGSSCGSPRFGVSELFSTAMCTSKAARWNPEIDEIALFSRTIMYSKEAMNLLEFTDSISLQLDDPMKLSSSIHHAKLSSHWSTVPHCEGGPAHCKWV